MCESGLRNQPLDIDLVWKHQTMTPRRLHVIAKPMGESWSEKSKAGFMSFVHAGLLIMSGWITIMLLYRAAFGEEGNAEKAYNFTKCLALGASDKGENFRKEAEKQREEAAAEEE